MDRLFGGEPGHDPEAPLQKGEVMKSFFEKILSNGKDAASKVD